MRGVVVAAAVALSCYPCAGGEFRLIDVPDAVTLERGLNRAAGDGYELLAGAVGLGADGKKRLVALLVREADGEAEPDRFRVLTSSGELDRRLPGPVRDLTEGPFAVADVIAHRLPDWWLPEESYAAQMIWILERRHDEPGARYVLQPLTTAVGTEEALAAQPLAARRLLKGRRRIYTLLGGDDIDRVEDGSPYRVLIEARRPRLRRRLTRLSKQGYEVVDAVASTVNAPPVMLLTRRATVRPRIYKILADPLELQRRGRLSVTIEQLAREGFELIPQTLLEDHWVAARPAEPLDETARPHYRLISSRDGDPAMLAQAGSREGFVFAALITAPAETLILMRLRERIPD